MADPLDDLLAEHADLEHRLADPAVHADQAFAVHDGLLNDVGLGLVTGLLGERGPGTPTPFSRLAPGDTVEL